MHDPVQWFQRTLQSPNLQTRLFSSLILVLLLWLLRLFTIYLVDRRTDDARVRYRWRKTSTYLSVLLGLLLLGWIWLEGLQSDIEFAYPTQRFYNRRLEKGPSDVEAMDDEVKL